MARTIRLQSDSNAHDRPWRVAVEQGFFAADTRFVSGYRLRLGRTQPVLLNSAVIQPWSARFGWRFWQIDFGWYAITFLELAGLATKVRRPTVVHD